MTGVCDECSSKQSTQLAVNLRSDNNNNIITDSARYIMALPSCDRYCCCCCWHPISAARKAGAEMEMGQWVMGQFQ